jgi:hypothetical protein
MASVSADLSKIAEILEEQDKREQKYPKIIDELRDLLNDLDDRSAAELEKSIKADGVRDPLVIWKEKNAIIDGHNRLKIIKKLNLPYTTKEMSFESIDLVKEWMIRNQLGRRNLTADRFDYYLGTLYNAEKQTSDKPGNLGGPREKGVDTAAKIATEFGVSERTVRRAGEAAIGIDKLEQIKGRMAKQKQLEGKGELTKPELTELGKMPNTAVGTKFLGKLAEIKAATKAKKNDDKKQQVALLKQPDTYSVIFCQPPVDDLGFNVSSQPKPPVSKDAMVYILVPDHAAKIGMDMIEKWGLTYEGSIIYYHAESEEGTYTKVVHEQLLLATKGVVTIKKGVEVSSVQKYTGQIGDAVVKLVETYHPSAKKLDMRKGHTAKGWEGIKVNV